MGSTWSFRAAMLAALAAGLAASPAVAQRSTTRGFTVGAHLQVASLTVEGDDEPSSGGGLGVRAGYGFNRRLTGYFEVDGIEFDVTNTDLDGRWTMGHADLGLRFNFANSLRRWVPFLEAALGGRFVNVEDAVVNGVNVGDLSFNGSAFSLGGGISFFAREKLAIETLMKFSGGTFEEVEVGNVSLGNLDIDASSFRFKIGIAWWP